MGKTVEAVHRGLPQAVLKASPTVIYQIFRIQRVQIVFVDMKECTSPKTALDAIIQLKWAHSTEWEWKETSTDVTWPNTELFPAFPAPEFLDGSLAN